MTYVHPTWQFTSKHVDEHRGWVFGEKGGKKLSNTSGIGSFPSNWGDEDPLMGAKSIREIYLKVNDTTGKYILPILWDKKFQTIVSNESSEIIRMLNSEFDEFAKNPELNLYPSDLAKEIDEVNKWVYPTFNNGVYRCGLSSTQNAYDEAIGKNEQTSLPFLSNLPSDTN
jgi:putative glutathione S-transferase